MPDMTVGLCPASLCLARPCANLGIFFESDCWTAFFFRLKFGGLFFRVRRAVAVAGLRSGAGVGLPRPELSADGC